MGFPRFAARRGNKRAAEGGRNKQ